MKYTRIFILFIALLSACSEKVVDPPSRSLTVTPNNNTLPVGHPELELPPQSREIKRLTVDMLAASVPIVAGQDADQNQIRWTITHQGQQVDALSNPAFTRTLGKPDYVQVTAEPAQPTALYAKFTDDMARDVCAKMLVADLAKADPNKRSLVRFASLTDTEDSDAINKNLRYLTLRFLGERIADNDDTGVSALKTLFDTVATANSAVSAPTEAWRAVCVALFTSPAFHLY